MHHTYPSWDAPPSGKDLSVFTTQSNMRRMTASSKEHIYIITKTSETPTYIPSLGSAFNAKMEDVFKTLCKEHNILVPSNTKLCNKLWRDAAIEAHRVMGKVAKYKFEVILR